MLSAQCSGFCNATGFQLQLLVSVIWGAVCYLFLLRFLRVATICLTAVTSKSHRIAVSLVLRTFTMQPTLCSCNNA